MRRLSRLGVVLLFLGAINLRCLAWSGSGHKVIAAIAYRQLSPSLKEKTVELLMSHPDYEKWEIAFSANSNLDFATFIFMRSSTWPDEIRRLGSEHDHPHWHYIDYPLRAHKFLFEDAPSPDDDALYAIAQCEKILADTNASPRLRAVQLSWLIHLIGELHQPLHCSSFVNETYPEGDKGGNDFYVRPTERGIKLHSLWDGLLGTSGSPATDLNYGIQLESEFPNKSLQELEKSKTPKAWSLDSRTLALEKAYLNGNLKGGTTAESALPLPADYTKTAKAVAERQAVLAGYRLASEIQNCMH